MVGGPRPTSNDATTPNDRSLALRKRPTPLQLVREHGHALRFPNRTNYP